MGAPQEGQRPPVGTQLEQISSSHGLMRIVAGFFLQRQQRIGVLLQGVVVFMVAVVWVLVTWLSVVT